MRTRSHTLKLHETVFPQKAIAWLLLVSMLVNLFFNLLSTLWLPIYAEKEAAKEVQYQTAAQTQSAVSAVQTGTVIHVTTALNVRSGPGTQYGIVGRLTQGATVTVLGTATASDGVAWYQISFLKDGHVTEGYVHSYYLSITEPPVPPSSDGAFESYLAEQKFPESYKPFLRAMHAQYPNWIFQAYHTKLEWKNVLDAESVIGRNLVPASSPDSWKSFEQGAYNWSDGTWYGLDGKNWVAASREIIAYYLDPRNALNTTAIFQFESLSYSPYHTSAGVDTILKNTFMSGSYTTPDTKKTYTYTETFMQAAAITGVSPYHLASRARQEQGVKGTALSFGTVPGYQNYFNFFNVRAYATASASAQVNGAIYAASTNTAYYLPWTNQYKSILGGAAILASGYISKAQDTLYLQKFDVVDGGNGYYAHQYMTNVVAPTSEATSLKKAYTEEMLRSTLVFNIPVYLNMPSAPAEKPASTGNNNNLLSALGIKGHKLTPSFNSYTMEYELVVDTTVSSVTVTASPRGAGATVTGTGTVSLQYGENLLPITVKATSGALRTYTVSVYRTPNPNPPVTPEGPSVTPEKPSVTPEKPPVANPALSSDLYRIGTAVTGILPGTDAATFLQHISVKNGKAALSAQAVGTGVLLELYATDGTLFATYPLIIYGDVTGDGKISAMDLLVLQKHLLQMTLLQDSLLQAADVNKSNSVSAIDLLLVQKHLLKTATISQANMVQ